MLGLLKWQVNTHATAIFLSKLQAIRNNLILCGKFCRNIQKHNFLSETVQRFHEQSVSGALIMLSKPLKTVLDDSKFALSKFNQSI